MKYTRGKALKPEEKYAIVSVKSYFDQNKKELGFSGNSAQLTADALEVSISTVKRVMADFRRNPDSLDKTPRPKGRPSYLLDHSNKEKTRRFIRDANQNGEYITLAILTDFLKKENAENNFHFTTLSRTLNRWGFEFGKGKRTQHLKEKDEIVVARQHYLRRMRANRSSNGKPIKNEVFLDESYINKNHSNDFTWYSEEDGAWIQKPTGKGERLIIIHAISSFGWIEGAKLVFQAKKKTGDYHGQMNAQIFQKWFAEKLIPNLLEPSLIVMDNASYHNALSSCSPPTGHSLKEEIINWLFENGIHCDQNLLKAELVTILKKISPSPVYEVDKIAKKYGHEIIRTPPYHPELQPIEICWGIVKNHTGRRCNFTLSSLKTKLEEGFKQVKPSTCLKIIRKIKEKEDEFWDEDMKFDPTE